MYGSERPIGEVLVALPVTGLGSLPKWMLNAAPREKGGKEEVDVLGPVGGL